jgi:hypothetical protein
MGKLDFEVIVCSNCDRELAQIDFITRDPDNEWTVVVDCPFCGDSSWERKVSGIFGFSEVHDLSIIDNPIEGEYENIIHVITKAKS